MNVFKEVALNFAIMLPPVRKMASRRHNTGLMSDPYLTRSMYNRLSEHVQLPGKDLLELGPGQTPTLLQYALQDGARSVSGLDVEQSYSVIWPKEMDLQIYDGRRMPFKDGSFDIIWSNACFEHLRYPELTVAECARLLRPGGSLVCQIDLRDHYQSDPALQAEHLRYPAYLWKLMTWNRSAYTNRVRCSQWESLLQENQMRSRIFEPQTSEALREAYATHPARGHYSESDFSTEVLFFVADRL